MLNQIVPKLPMQDKIHTRQFYTKHLGFEDIGYADFDGYLLLAKDQIEIHFFEHRDLDPDSNDGQVYIRTSDIDSLYKTFLENRVKIHPNGALSDKPWGQREFSILDPDHNLLTFGQKL